MSSPTNAGRNAQCQPIRRTSTSPTTTSSASFQGEAAPAKKNGKATSWTKSAPIAIARAIAIRRDRGRGPAGSDRAGGAGVSAVGVPLSASRTGCP